jgi:hypothetical protein
MTTHTSFVFRISLASLVLLGAACGPGKPKTAPAPKQPVAAAAAPAAPQYLTVEGGPEVPGLTIDCIGGGGASGDARLRQQGFRCPLTTADGQPGGARWTCKEGTEPAIETTGNRAKLWCKPKRK